MEPPAFRHNIPACAPPDRAAWHAEHGKAPRELKGIDPRYALQAERQLARDAGTIDRTTAIAAATVLDEICEGVLIRAGLDDTHIVHYDPATRSFWDYPL